MTRILPPQIKFQQPSDLNEIDQEPLVVHQHKLDNKAMIIFVHGLGGCRYGEDSTWGRFPEFIYDDFPKFDVGLYAYPTLLKFGPTLPKEAEVFEGIIRQLKTYETIILIGHSEGGLLCWAAICAIINSCQKNLLSRIGGLILMATPQAGSQRVPWFAAWLSKDFDALKPHGEFVKYLNDTLVNHRIVLDESRARLGETVIPTWAVLGASDHWVDDLSAGLHLPDSRKTTVRGSHTRIVKPQSKQDDAYQYVHGCVQEVWRRRRHGNDLLGAHTIVTEHIGLRFRQAEKVLPIYPLAEAEQAFPARREAFGLIEMRREPFEIFLSRRTWQTPNDDYPALQVTVSDNHDLFELANFDNPPNASEVDSWLESMPFFWTGTGMADAEHGSGALYAVTDLSDRPFGHNYIIGGRFNQEEAFGLGIYVSCITDDKGRDLLQTAASIYMVFHLHNKAEELPSKARIDPLSVDLVRINLVD